MRFMIKSLFAALIAMALAVLPACAQAATRALLIACSDFVTHPDLGNAVSGNIHMIGSALISSDMPLGAISIEDGTIGTPDALRTAVCDAFADTAEGDLSILYLCTHGVLSSADDGEVYLLLGDGQTETPISAKELYETVADIQGEKLLIIDACFSGAIIGRGTPPEGVLPGSIPRESSSSALFLSDPGIHVLTSASGFESSWYYDSEHLATGAVSYFASALSTGLGLYGMPEADLNGDGAVTLSEIHRYLNAAVPSSSSQLLSARADAITLPTSHAAALSRPLTGFSYGASLISTGDPALDFSFTVTKEMTGVQYRLIEYADGTWDWENAVTFLDSGENTDGTLSPGRKTRTLTLEDALPGDSGYLMLQVFSVSAGEVILCSERLIGVQPVSSEKTLSISCPDVLLASGKEELPIDIRTGVPAELTVSVYDQDGILVRRLASGLMTRPAPGGVTRIYWDGRDASGKPVVNGTYVIACETRISGIRQKATASVSVGPIPL